MFNDEEFKNTIYNDDLVKFKNYAYHYCFDGFIDKAYNLATRYKAYNIKEFIDNTEKFINYNVTLPSTKMKSLYLYWLIVLILISI